ncbi:hypothetical protein ACQ4PT_060423 [Festuca glaucescens]
MEADEKPPAEVLRAAPPGMEAQKKPPAEVLRAAAAEVTRSTKHRVKLFRDTLPPLLGKVKDSASDTTLLVELIFQTLPLYDDRASRKAVDDMVIRALSESTFMKPFATTLVQSMEKNLKVTSPLACFKLLRWSSYLMKWTQFATLSKGGFPRLANAQAFLSQVLMDGSFRQRRTCKQLFIGLFAESREIYKMYTEEVIDSRISTWDSPAFINLILDFTVAPSSLLSEYKPIFLDFYVKTILGSNEQPSEAVSEAFKPLFLDIGHEDFKNVVLPSCLKMLKRNPEIVLKPIRHLLTMVRLDLSNYSMEFMPVVLHQALHSDEERRINALSIVATLSKKSSDPNTLPSMFNAIKAILGGSEGKLLPYQRVGMLNALEQLSRFSPKQISRLAPSVSSFLLTCYKGDGIEEVKLAALSALGSWASVSSEAVQPDVVSFITAGLKEKDTLRKGHLKLIRVICKRSDSLTKVTSLLDHLIQLSKTGFTKATQRLDGIYALYAISRLAAIDAKADGSIVKEKVWPLIAQSEPSVISAQLLSKLTDEDCLTCVDLLQSLLVDHLFRVQEYFSVQSLLQVLIFLVCHPSWAVRKIAYDATNEVLSSSGELAEAFLFLFTDWLSLVGERISRLKQSDMDSSGDSQLPFIPSTEVLVKCLFLIAPYVVGHGQGSYSRLILCSHHPCISSSGSPGGVWKRLQRRLKQPKIFLTDLIFPNISVICKELLSQDGLFSSNKQKQHATLCSLSTLMTISPNDTFTEFEKHLELPYRALHDGFSENDKIFLTSEGKLSTEQGIYVAEAVASRNTKLANGRFRAYDVQDEDPAKSDRRELSSIAKRESGKSEKKNAPVDKSKTAKEEARELLLKEEPSVPEKVGHVQKNLELMLDAFGELAIADPIYTHSQLPHLIMEMILLSSKKTFLHDDVLQILSMHQKILPLPRPRMLSVLYHVLSTVPAYHPSVGPMLNELCLGLKFNDLAQALVGVYAKEAVAELAKELWDSFGFSVCIDYSGIFNALSHEHHHIRAAAAEALTAALDKNRDKVKETLSILFQLYILYLDPGVEFGDTNWVGRQGIALALHSVADVLSSKDLPDVMMFLILHALVDPNMEVRGRMISACIRLIDMYGKDNPTLLFPLIDKHGKENAILLFPVIKSYMNSGASDNETYFLFRKCYIVLTEAIAQHLATDDPKVYMAAKKLLDELIMSAQSFQGVPNLRKMHLSLSYEPLLSYIQSGGTLFDVLSEKVAEAIFSALYCKELSNIPVVLIQTYVEPKPEEEAVENRHAIMDILNTA